MVRWQVEGDAGEVIEPIRHYLRGLAAQGKSDKTLRSYAHDLLRWWRFLSVVDIAGHQPGSVHPDRAGHH
ncbi:hypothetical protein [Actinomadura chokoriensis]|uniref:hypothetical protein n=1 Tax=Actinomadura chokoriensis TaxID=454156 RepID=UPI0031FA03FC